MSKHLNSVTDIIEKIESNLKAPFKVSDLAEQSGMSRWQFQRIFSSLVGHSMGDYIRRRRLTEAMKELQEGKARILDIAIDYQFSSHEAFTRAFKEVFGISPSQWEKHPEKFHLQKRVQITKEMLDWMIGGFDAKPEIVEVPDKIYVGKSTTIKSHLGDKQNFKDVYEFWMQFSKERDLIKNQVSSDSIGLAICEDELASEQITYLALVEVHNKEGQPDDFVVHIEKGGTYAKFSKKGVTGVTWYAVNAIYGTWLPQSSYTRANRNDFEVFPSEFDTDNPESLSFYYLPIEKNS